MSKNFNVLRGITMASALHGAEKQELLAFINQIERSITNSASSEGLDRK